MLCHRDGRVKLTDVESFALARTKVTHILTVLLALICTVAWNGTGTQARATKATYMYAPFAFFMLAGIADAFQPGAEPKEMLVGVARALGGFVLGFASFVIFVNLAQA